MKLIIIIMFLFGPSNSTKFVLSNPYPIKLEVEVKCDYDYSKKIYKYYKRITINKKTNRTIYIPYSQRCDIIPIDYELQLW